MCKRCCRADDADARATILLRCVDIAARQKPKTKNTTSVDAENCTNRNRIALYALAISRLSLEKNSLSVILMGYTLGTCITQLFECGYCTALFELVNTQKQFKTRTINSLLSLSAIIYIFGFTF